jgi:hypothetical protein
VQGGQSVQAAKAPASESRVVEWSFAQSGTTSRPDHNAARCASRHLHAPCLVPANATQATDRRRQSKTGHAIDRKAGRQ